MVERTRLNSTRQAASGFTLLEVLVALALLAIALAAALQAAGRGAADLAYLRDRTFATWVAGNELTRRTLLPEWPEPGVTRGVAAMAGREWPWELEVSATGDAAVRRLEVRVETEAESRPLASLTGFVLRPLEERQATGQPGAAQGQAGANRKMDATRKADAARKGGTERQTAPGALAP